MADEILWQCNESELVGMARKQGLPLLRRGLPQADLISIVSGMREPREDELAGTIHSRVSLQLFINQNWGRVSSQLPGCNGQCTTYPCSEGRHVACFYPNEKVVLSTVKR
jgi:hypothetical protein